MSFPAERPKATRGREPIFLHRFRDPLPKARNASLAGGDTGWREGKGTHLPSPFLDPLPKARNASLAGGDTGWREGKIAIA
ncbi:MAG: hypothetical protein JO196_06895 [Hyphomicrobiales bacterium]|nr:hypothetical protein [Hyphomicrobiales bacterium]